MLLLYVPDYEDEPAGIEQLHPWSDFIKEHCSGATDTETIWPEKILSIVFRKFIFKLSRLINMTPVNPCDVKGAVHGACP